MIYTRCVLKIFLPFCEKNERIFFLIGLTKNDRQKTLFSAEKSLHYFTREEAFCLKHHHHHHRELTLSESALFTLERKKHVLTTRDNKVRSLFLSVVHEIKESLDDDDETTFRSSV